MRHPKHGLVRPRFLDVSGALITIDAMGCQREIANQIRQRGGDYVLAVKPNQPKLSEQVEEAIDSATSDRDEDVAVIRRFVYRFSSNSASMTSSVWPASGPPFGEAEGPFLAAPSPGDAAAA